MPVTYSVGTPDFDSELGNKPDPGDNATQLTVVLRLEFIAIEAQTARDLRGKVFRARPWDDGAFRQYLMDFRSSVEDYWNDRIYIWFPNPNKPQEAMPKADYLRFLSPRLKDQPPYLTCRLSIKFCDKSCHARIYVLNLEPGQGRFQNRAYRKVGSADTIVLDNESVQIRTTTVSERDVYRQLPAAHEIGHLLDLDHVNATAPECKLDKNAEICYGGTPYERNDIMGLGSAVSGNQAKTWLKAIRLHTGHEKGWRASHLSPPLEALLDEAVRGGR